MKTFIVLKASLITIASIVTVLSTNDLELNQILGLLNLIMWATVLAKVLIDR